MRNLIKLGALAAALAVGGCATVLSGSAPSTNAVGDIWYTTGVGIPGMVSFSTHVYYCPKPTGPAVGCKEAKYVEAAPAK